MSKTNNNFPVVAFAIWFGVIFPMVINAAFAFYLLRKETTGFFGVTGQTRKNTIIVDVAVALVVTVTGRIIYRISPSRALRQISRNFTVWPLLTEWLLLLFKSD